MGETNEKLGEGNGTTGGRKQNVIDVSWATDKFFFLTHFIFILLTKLFRYYFKLLATTTMMEQPPPLTCEPLAHRVDCREEKNRETERSKTK